MEIKNRNIWQIPVVLRWHEVTYVSKYNRYCYTETTLQQQVINIDTGETEWRDIPTEKTVIER